MFLTNKMRLFLVGCIGTRIAISFLAKYIGEKMKWMLPYAGLIALIPAIGFISIFLGNLREKGTEAGGRIWWNNMRPIHGVMYLLFAIYAFRRKPFAWRVLFIDVLIGLAVWFRHYF
jgi:hypothetical protein